MKIFLDDVRETPNGWTRTYWPDETIKLLKDNIVTEISLDHDLGNDEKGTGYDVLLWIEEQVFLYDYKPPIIYIHSSNSSAVSKMKRAVENIKRRLNESSI